MSYEFKEIKPGLFLLSHGKAKFYLDKAKWPKITIPKEDTPNKRAISHNMLRRFFAVVPDFSRFTHPLQELGQDVALISFCMCGIIHGQR